MKGRLPLVQCDIDRSDEDSFADRSGNKRLPFRLGGSGNVYGDRVKIRVGGEIFP